MKMKKIILNVALVFAAAVMGSCDSFFEVDTDDTLDGRERNVFGVYGYHGKDAGCR